MIRRMIKNKPQNGWRFGILFIVLFVVGFVSWLWWQDSVGPVDPQNSEVVVFTIEKGEGIKSISSRLVSEQLIRSAPGFYVLIKLQGLDQQIQAGQFRLNRSMDALAIAQALTHGFFDKWITIVEGWRIEEIATRLAGELDIPESEFLKYAKEGYMFPDSYLVAPDATAGAMAQLLQQTFEKKVTEKYKDQISSTGLSFEQTLILASIVEREGRNDQDRPIIAGILLNRLNADWPLQADATLQYALGYQSFEKSWWKKELTEVDKSIKSTYNTYLYTGLPPAPIANPGLSSIQAAVNPIKTDFWFYIHDKKGVVHYAKTIEEHNQNISLYLD